MRAAKRLPPVIVGDLNLIAYRGYLIRWTIFTLYKPEGRMWVEKDGQLICWANIVDEAKKMIDEAAG